MFHDVVLASQIFPESEASDLKKVERCRHWRILFSYNRGLCAMSVVESGCSSEQVPGVWVMCTTAAPHACREESFKRGHKEKCTGEDGWEQSCVAYESLIKTQWYGISKACV